MTTATTVEIAEPQPVGSICEPGAYVCLWNGHLLRVPAEGLDSGRCPHLCIAAAGPLDVIRISDDPYVDVDEARRLAAGHAVPTTF